MLSFQGCAFYTGLVLLIIADGGLFHAVVKVIDQLVANLVNHITDSTGRLNLSFISFF